MNRRGSLAAVAGILALCQAPIAFAQPRASVAVFNFQMKSNTPDWVWLEKFLSDQITTDFVRSGVGVIARDEMQIVAQQMAWAPEMATTDGNAMGRIRQVLKIEHLVTGVCSVEGNQVQVTGQVVAVGDRKEVFRWTGSAPAPEILGLQKKLSAELLAWFTKGKAEAILPTLPVWTRSIPAVKALYQGMDLYDQGRYAEAWLRFRQASREDGAYVEAVYWVGKMYYFMNRYEHARRALEQFVYLDAFHPRTEDAILEYIRTYENLDLPAPTLLELYTSLRRKFPPGLIAEGWLSNWLTEEVRKDGRNVRFPTLEDWLRFRIAHILGEMGRHREAAEMTGPALDLDGKPVTPLCLWNLLQDSAKTGRSPDANVLTDMDPNRPWNRAEVVCFTAGQIGQERTFVQPKQLVGKNLADKWTASNAQQGLFLEVLVPSGHVLRSLTVYPRAEGAATLTVDLGTPGASPYPSRSADVAAARAGGIRFDDVPRLGMIAVQCTFKAKDDGQATVHGVGLAATWAKIDRPGAIQVDCQDRAGFRVDLDGVYARTGPGLIGPVAAGEHTLRFFPAEANLPCTPWTARVTVREGNTAAVLGRLPWKPASPWAGWSTTLVGRDYPARGFLLGTGVSAPWICADDEAIRVVWSVGGELWLSASTDGNSYTPPRRIPLPVSSGWTEESPKLIRDEQGRFVMMFTSNRDAQHRKLLYSTWSRDLVHWSAPALALDRSVGRWDFAQDPQGRFLFAFHSLATYEVLASRDALNWVPQGKTEFLQHAYIREGLALVRGDDGRLELFASGYERDTGPDNRFVVRGSIARRTSGDGKEWSGPLVLDGPHSSNLAAVRAGGMTVCFINGAREPSGAVGAKVLVEGPGEQWRVSKLMPGLFDGDLSAAYRKRWGYVLAWMAPPADDWSPPRAHGPFVMRGRTLEPLLATMTVVRPSAQN